MESSAKSQSRSTADWAGRPPSTPRPARESNGARIDRANIEELWRAPSSATERRERLRRAANVAMALAGIVLLAPVMLAIAVLVKLTSRGPVLYTQKRVGRDRRTPPPQRPSENGKRNGSQDARDRDLGGRIFTIYKFRTMYTDSGDEQVWARPDDERVTPLGRVLRALHLDELPQLFNVLRGDMNVVGPRPEQPEIFQRLANQVPGYRIRQQVRPGITGLAQVNHHYDRTLDDVQKKVELDLEYLERRSPGEDMRIVLRTVPAVIAEDAQGW